MRNKARIGVVFAVCAVAFLGLAALMAPATEARTPPNACECANIYYPVTCSNGVTYINPCVASCQGATDCVPTGGGGIP